MSLRLAFMGSPAFAVPALDAVVASGHDVAAVYTQPPRAAGRGKKLRPVPVAVRANALGLEVRHPASLRDSGVQAAFRALELDVAVVAAYGLLLPRAILDAPVHGCINIHPSLLPRWRGAAPIPRAIMAGDTETGVCIMRMDEGLDTGPVLAHSITPIPDGETAADLHDRLAGLGARMLVETLTQIEAGQAVETPQAEDGIVYAAKIDKAEARIDWSRSAHDLRAHIHGLSPFPGAWCEISGERIKVLRVALSDSEGAPGALLDPPGTIACGAGALHLLEVQRAGRPPLEMDAFLRGFDWPTGATLD